jgi:hypothetical protein
MKKFNNTLEGTDCGDAGLPARCRDIIKTKTILRVVPKTPDAGSMAIQFLDGRSDAIRPADVDVEREHRQSRP